MFLVILRVDKSQNGYYRENYRTRCNLAYGDTGYSIP